MANCRQCDAELPSFSFGEASPYCKTCRSQISVASTPPPATGFSLPQQTAIASGPSIATLVLLAINIGIFVIMLASGVSWISPETDQMLRWGADYGPYTLSGQFWRLIASMFLHFGIIHLFGNMWCLWSLGRLAEKLLGSFSLLGLYVVTGVGASLLSLSWDPMRVSAGASGAIFGIAGGLISVLHFGKLGLQPEGVRKLLGYVVRFAFLNLLFGLRGHVDNMAHLGGLVSGLLVGYFFARTFNASPDERPGRQKTILAISTIVIAMLFVPVAKAKQYAVEFDKGRTAFEQSHYQVAIDHMQKYSSARPNDEYPHALLGASFQKLGRTDDAIREYERGLALNPEYHHIQVNLAELYLFQNKPEKAVPLFEEGLTTFNDDADVMYSYGKALKQTGKLSGAESALRKTLQLDSKLIEAHELLSDVLKEEGKTNEAREQQHLADLLQTQKPSGDGNNAKAH